MFRAEKRKKHARTPSEQKPQKFEKNGGFLTFLSQKSQYASAGNPGKQQ